MRAIKNKNTMMSVICLSKYLIFMGGGESNFVVNKNISRHTDMRPL